MAAQTPIGRRFERWQKGRADERLFRHLAEVHGLEKDDVELLVSLADHHQLVRIAEIFLRPSLFSLNPDAERWPARNLVRIRQRIFEGSEKRDRQE